MTVNDKTTKELLNDQNYYLERLEAGVRSIFERKMIERKLLEVSSEIAVRDNSLTAVAG